MKENIKRASTKKRELPPLSTPHPKNTPTSPSIKWCMIQLEFVQENDKNNWDFFQWVDNDMGVLIDIMERTERKLDAALEGIAVNRKR